MPLLVLFIIALCSSAAFSADVVVINEQSNAGFKFKKVPLPAVDDAAANARADVVEGKPDRKDAAKVLTDGKLPTKRDEPRANFFFAHRENGGRVRLDLGKVTDVSRIATYSWHPSTRGPQVYTVYASETGAEGFNPRPTRAVDPTKAGWKKLANVDTRGNQQDGAQHGVLISAKGGGSLGKFRYLLFDALPTDDLKGPFGNTFYSEIDVHATGAAKPESVKPAEPVIKQFASGQFRWVVNATKAPDLMPWVEKELMPAVAVWYPKMIGMLPSKGYDAPKAVLMEFKTGMRPGVPAYASGNGIALSVPFFRQQLKGEAKGCVIHELVHVIQSYHRARFTTKNPTKTPGWVTEGTADYIRWFLFEPEKKGAEINKRMLDAGVVKYDASYRITGNFIDWVVRNHDKDLLRKLNEAAREGRYSDELWEKWTGKPLKELANLWVEYHRKRLD